MIRVIPFSSKIWPSAAECFVIAQRLKDAAEKQSLIAIAQAWMVLAEHAEKHSVLLDKPNQ
jgi:hypothetical protein